MIFELVENVGKTSLTIPGRGVKFDRAVILNDATWSNSKLHSGAFGMTGMSFLWQSESEIKLAISRSFNIHFDLRVFQSSRPSPENYFIKFIKLCQNAVEKNIKTKPQDIRKTISSQSEDFHAS